MIVALWSGATFGSLLLSLTLTLTPTRTLTLTLTRWESDAQREAASTPLEVRLAPGDVVYFPSRWAHYTEALPAPAAGVEDGDAGDAEGDVGGDAGGAGDAEDDGLSFSLGFRTDGAFLV